MISETASINSTFKMLQVNAFRIIRHVQLINRIKVCGSVLSSSSEHRQFLMETKTLQPNDHRNEWAAPSYTVSEKIFINLLDEKIMMPKKGDRVLVDGMLKRVNFCDSSFVEDHKRPIVERSLRFGLDIDTVINASKKSCWLKNQTET